MSKKKKFYKYRRLNCGSTSKQCGMGCIPRDHKCDGKAKSKMSLLKNNVKKDISRLENGGDFGKVSEKAFAKILVTDKEIGQKMPAAMTPIVANSSKLDDRVKKAYIDSATRKSWNWKGKYTSVKLKKEDPAFQRKISNRKLTHNVPDVPQEKERDEKKERKKFFATDGGKKVLKTLASVAVVGGVAAAAAYTISSAKKEKDPKPESKTFGMEEDTSDALAYSRKTWKESPQKQASIETQAQAIYDTGDKKSAQIIAKDKFYDNPNTVYESYTDVYQRAHKLNKLNEAGNLSTRNKDDYISMWGFSPEQSKDNKVDGQLIPKPESTLGLARKRVIDDLNDQGYTTESDHKAVLAYHTNPKNFERIKKFGRKYNPETNRYELPKNDADTDMMWTPAQERDESFKYPKKTSEEKYEEKEALNKYEREQDASPFGRMQDDLQRTKNDAREPYLMSGEIPVQRVTAGGNYGKWEEKEGSQIENEEWLYKQSIENKNKPGFRTTSANPGLSETQKNNQRKEWTKMSREDRLAYNDVDLLRQVSPNDDYGSVFGTSGVKEKVEAKLRDLYRNDTQLEAMRENNIEVLERDIMIGRAVLPEYKSIAVESENAQKSGGAWSASTGGEKSEYGGIENIAGEFVPQTQFDRDVRDARSTTRGKGWKNKTREYKYEMQPGEQRRVVESKQLPKFEKTSAGTEQVISKSGQFLVRRKDPKGNYIYYWKGKKLPVNTPQGVVKYLKKKKQWDFAEEYMEPFVYEIIEENGGIIICRTDEGLIAYDFSNDENYRTIYL